jgi:DNA-binding transcriptional ArsR family regulator
MVGAIPSIEAKPPLSDIEIHVLICIYHFRHTQEVIDTVWSVLVDPHRREVLALLGAGPRPVGEIVEALGLSQPATSKHLRVLRDAGVVQVSIDAQRRIYAIDPRPLAEVDAWLEPYRELWSERLDALGKHLDATKET